MAERTDLASLLATFRTIEKQIVEKGRQVSHATAEDFVQARRRLAEAFGEVGAALERDPRLQADPAKLRDASRLFSAFRSQHSIVQADWPVVRVRDDVPGYQNAVQPVGERSRDFWLWVEQQLEAAH